MKTKILEVYDFYKRQHNSEVALFHIGREYIAFFNDAIIVKSVISHQITSNILTDGLSACSFNDNMLDEVLDVLYRKNGISFTIVEYRGIDGSYCLPKVKQILKDIEDDY